MLFAAAAPFFLGGNEESGDQPLGASSTLVISNTDSVSQIESDLQALLDNAAYDTVIVTGAKTNVDVSLELTIPAGKTLIWKATYTGYDDDYSCIYLYGAGTFEVADGAVLISAGQDVIIAYYDDVAIIVSGGLVEALDDADGIHVGSEGFIMTGGTVRSSTGDGAIYSNTGGNVTISAGLVESTGGKAIYCQDDVTISGGTVRSAGDYLNTITGDKVTMTGGQVETISDYSNAICAGDKVTMTGGTVKATGEEGCAIDAGGDVVITDGTVQATGDYGAAILASGNIAVTGGKVQATGTDSYAILAYDCIAIYLEGTVYGDIGIASGHDGTIVAVAILNPPASYDGTNNDITIEDQEGSTWAIEDISWDLSGSNPLIVFDGGPTFVWLGAGIDDGGDGDDTVPPDTGAPAGGPGGKDNTLLYVGIALIAVIVIAALVYFFVLKKK